MGAMKQLILYEDEIMGADYRQQQELEEYEQWLDDPVAQKEYQQWLENREGERGACESAYKKEKENVRTYCSR